MTVETLSCPPFDLCSTRFQFLPTVPLPVPRSFLAGPGCLLTLGSCSSHSVRLQGGSLQCLSRLRGLRFCVSVRFASKLEFIRWVPMETPSSSSRDETEDETHMLEAITRLWIAGFKDALCLHRAVAFCSRSRVVFIKTSQCFLLNGCIFLGSIYFLQTVVVPALNWLLGPRSINVGSLGNPELTTTSGAVSDAVHNVLIGICYVFWLYPLYIVSFVINCIWYNEIARHAFEVAEQAGGRKAAVSSPHKAVQSSSTDKPNRNQDDMGSITRVMLGIGEQIYSIMMVSTFFVEVFAVSFIPYVGTLLYFVLLSWLYAYYCFDYKWGFGRWSLEKRLLFFESNWAFFAGFGSPCVLATFFFSPLVSAGVMAVLFPLFVLIATASNPEDVVGKCPGRKQLANSGLGRLPIFYLANYITLPLLRLFQPSSAPPHRQARGQRHRM